MIYLNGQFMPLEEAKIPVLDRGFIFGDAVYELVPVYSRVPFRLDEHLIRLGRSLAAVRIRDPYPRERWRELIGTLIARQPFEDQGLYLQVTRGVAKRDHAFAQGIEPTVFMMANPLVNPSLELVERGVAALSATDFRWLRCDIKVTSLIGNCMLRQVSADAGAAETILFRDGRLSEASASNVFVVREGTIQAPPKSNLILPGITYDVVLELAQAAGIALELRDLSEAEVRAADEIWLTSSSKEILAVVSLDGRKVGDGRPGPVFRRMYGLYQEFKQRVMRGGGAAQAA